ncbi:hypothetical protein ACFL5N_00140 [bacterium]
MTKMANLINVISNYLEMPNQSISKQRLYDSINSQAEYKKYLQDQELVIKNLSKLEKPSLSSSIASDVLTKLSNPQPTSFLHGFKEMLVFKPWIATSLAALVLGTSMLVTTLFYNPFEVKDYKNTSNLNTAKNVNTIIKPINLRETYKAVPNPFISNYKGITYDEILEFDVENKALADMVQDTQNIQGFRGDLEEYVPIDKTEVSNMSLALLNEAQRELFSGIADLSRIDKLLYKALIMQHKVELLESRDDKEGGENNVVQR